MAKTKISEFSATAASNTDIDSINLAEGMAPSLVNDAIRELMAQLKDFQTGAVGDSFGGPITGAVNATVGATTPNTGAFTTLAASGAVTLSGGTANGVTYLNGSKVLTSGSALVFDGTNLGVGTSSPAYKLDVKGNIRSGLASTTTGEIAFFSASNDSQMGIINNATEFKIYSTYASTAGYKPINFYTSDTLKMTLDADGDLGIGTSSPGQKLDVNGSINVSSSGNIFTASSSGIFFNGSGSYSTGIYNNASGSLLFDTNGSNRARIDSSGNLLVGTTSTFGKLTTYSTATGTPTAGFFANTASFTSNVLGISCARTTTNATFNLIYAYNDNLSGQFAVRDSGNCVNTNNSYGAISDVKLKENIVDASPKLADLMQVKVRNYNLKTEPDHKQLGVIAQELESVFPAMVEESPDRDKQGNDLGTKTKSVKYSVFVPMLVKALQEAVAEINSLKARLDAANL